jgi:RNA polymerase II subunit A-like phosphatase
MQAKLMDDVSEARPLAKLQEELEKDDDRPGVADAGKEDVLPEKEKEAVSSGQADEEVATSSRSTTPPPRHRKQLLNDDDRELDRVSLVSC